MKTLILALALLISTSHVYAANVKIFDLTEDTAPATTDILEKEDSGGTLTRKITIGNLLAAATDLDANGVISANAVALTTDTTGNYAAGDAEAGAATSGDSATSFFTTGNIDVAQGGTGATTLTDGGILLGSGTGAITALGVATNGQIPIGDGTTDPVLATVTGTADEITITNGAGTITIDIPDPLIVGKGGSGAATFTDGGILLGSGTGAFTALGVATNGQIPIGDGTTDPVLAAITGTANEVTVTNGAGTITLDLPLNAGTDITADLEEEVTSGSLADNTITDAELATTETIQLPIYSAKLTGAFVVRTPTSGDASTQGAQIDAGDGNWRLLFDATTDEAAVWQFVLPDYWAAHSELKVMFSMTSGEANEVEFEADVMCYTPTTDTANIGTDGFAGVAVGTATTVSATAGEAYLQSITLTDDSCAAGDIIFIYLSTDANDATNDDATGDREVVGLAYEFTR